MCGTTTRAVTLAEVSKHCHKSDCWVIIHRNVYDVTKYIPEHPGGAMIYVKAGGDCSQLFDSYHTKPYVRKVLEKFKIAQLEDDAVVTTYEQQGKDDLFYTELKHSMITYFQENKMSTTTKSTKCLQLNPRFSTSMYCKAAVILFAVAASASLAFYGAVSYQVALLGAVVLGFGMAEVGISIQHDANHGAFCRNGYLCYLVGLTLDAVGASSFMWKQQHVVGHHAYTNVISEDPDIRVKPGGTDVRRVVQQQPKGLQHPFQHLYLGVLYGLLAAKSILVDDFSALASGGIGPVKIAPFAAHESFAFWIGKALFTSWFVVAPLLWSHWTPYQLGGLWAVALAICGWTLAFMFQVAHVVDEVQFLEKQADGTVQGSWAKQQIATCADFCHGSWFWTHISGGLNYQAIHHLFPGVIHTHYPALAPIVRALAEKHGVPYKVYPSFFAALRGHFRQLQKSGTSMAIPSLHTIG